jgi:hypothetical protein
MSDVRITGITPPPRTSLLETSTDYSAEEKLIAQLNEIISPNLLNHTQETQLKFFLKNYNGTLPLNYLETFFQGNMDIIPLLLSANKEKVGEVGKVDSLIIEYNHGKNRIDSTLYNSLQQPLEGVFIDDYLIELYLKKTNPMDYNAHGYFDFLLDENYMFMSLIINQKQDFLENVQNAFDTFFTTDKTAKYYSFIKQIKVELSKDYNIIILDEELNSFFQDTNNFDGENFDAKKLYEHLKTLHNARSFIDRFEDSISFEQFTNNVLNLSPEQVFTHGIEIKQVDVSEIELTEVDIRRDYPKIAELLYDNILRIDRAELETMLAGYLKQEDEEQLSMSLEQLRQMQLIPADFDLNRFKGMASATFDSNIFTIHDNMNFIKEISLLFSISQEDVIDNLKPEFQKLEINRNKKIAEQTNQILKMLTDNMSNILTDDNFTINLNQLASNSSISQKTSYFMDRVKVDMLKKMFLLSSDEFYPYIKNELINILEKDIKEGYSNFRINSEYNKNLFKSRIPFLNLNEENWNDFLSFLKEHNIINEYGYVNDDFQERFNKQSFIDKGFSADDVENIEKGLSGLKDYTQIETDANQLLKVLDIIKEAQTYPELIQRLNDLINKEEKDEKLIMHAQKILFEIEKAFLIVRYESSELMKTILSKLESKKLLEIIKDHQQAFQATKIFVDILFPEIERNIRTEPSSVHRFSKTNNAAHEYSVFFDTVTNEEQIPQYISAFERAFNLHYSGSIELEQINSKNSSTPIFQFTLENKTVIIHFEAKKSLNSDFYFDKTDNANISNYPEVDYLFYFEFSEGEGNKIFFPDQNFKLQYYDYFNTGKYQTSSVANRVNNFWLNSFSDEERRRYQEKEKAFKNVGSLYELNIDALGLVSPITAVTLEEIKESNIDLSFTQYEQSFYNSYVSRVVLKEDFSIRQLEDFLGEKNNRYLNALEGFLGKNLRTLSIVELREIFKSQGLYNDDLLVSFIETFCSQFELNNNLSHANPEIRKLWLKGNLAKGEVSSPHLDAVLTSTFDLESTELERFKEIFSLYGIYGSQKAQDGSVTNILNITNLATQLPKIRQAWGHDAKLSEIIAFFQDILDNYSNYFVKNTLITNRLTEKFYGSIVSRNNQDVWQPGALRDEALDLTANSENHQMIFYNNETGDARVYEWDSDNSIYIIHPQEDTTSPDLPEEIEGLIKKLSVIRASDNLPCYQINKPNATKKERLDALHLAIKRFEARFLDEEFLQLMFFGIRIDDDSIIDPEQSKELFESLSASSQSEESKIEEIIAKWITDNGYVNNHQLLENLVASWNLYLSEQRGEVRAQEFRGDNVANQRANMVMSINRRTPRTIVKEIFKRISKQIEYFQDKLDSASENSREFYLYTTILKKLREKSLFYEVSLNMFDDDLIADYQVSTFRISSRVSELLEKEYEKYNSRLKPYENISDTITTPHSYPISAWQYMNGFNGKQVADSEQRTINITGKFDYEDIGLFATSLNPDRITSTENKMFRYTLSKTDRNLLEHLQTALGNNRNLENTLPSEISASIKHFLEHVLQNKEFKEDNNLELLSKFLLLKDDAISNLGINTDKWQEIKVTMRTILNSYSLIINQEDLETYNALLLLQEKMQEKGIEITNEDINRYQNKATKKLIIQKFSQELGLEDSVIEKAFDYIRKQTLSAVTSTSQLSAQAMIYGSGDSSFDNTWTSFLFGRVPNITANQLQLNLATIGAQEISEQQEEIDEYKILMLRTAYAKSQGRLAEYAYIYAKYRENAEKRENLIREIHIEVGRLYEDIFKSDTDNTDNISSEASKQIYDFLKDNNIISEHGFLVSEYLDKLDVKFSDLLGSLNINEEEIKSFLSLLYQQYISTEPINIDDLKQQLTKVEENINRYLVSANSFVRELTSPYTPDFVNWVFETFHEKLGSDQTIRAPIISSEGFSQFHSTMGVPSFDINGEKVSILELVSFLQNYIKEKKEEGLLDAEIYETPTFQEKFKIFINYMPVDNLLESLDISPESLDIDFSEISRTENNYLHNMGGTFPVPPPAKNRMDYSPATEFGDQLWRQSIGLASPAPSVSNQLKHLLAMNSFFASSSEGDVIEALNDLSLTDNQLRLGHVQDLLDLYKEELGHSGIETNEYVVFLEKLIADNKHLDSFILDSEQEKILLRIMLSKTYFQNKRYLEGMDVSRLGLLDIVSTVYLGPFSNPAFLSNAFDNTLANYGGFRNFSDNAIDFATFYASYPVIKIYIRFMIQTLLPIQLALGLAQDNGEQIFDENGVLLENSAAQSFLTNIINFQTMKTLFMNIPWMVLDVYGVDDDLYNGNLILATLKLAILIAPFLKSPTGKLKDSVVGRLLSLDRYIFGTPARALFNHVYNHNAGKIDVSKMREFWHTSDAWIDNYHRNGIIFMGLNLLQENVIAGTRFEAINKLKFIDLERANRIKAELQELSEELKKEENMRALVELNTITLQERLLELNLQLKYIQDPDSDNRVVILERLFSENERNTEEFKFYQKMLDNGDLVEINNEIAQIKEKLNLTESDFSKLIASRQNTQIIRAVDPEYIGKLIARYSGDSSKESKWELLKKVKSLLIESKKIGVMNISTHGLGPLTFLNNWATQHFQDNPHLDDRMSIFARKLVAFNRHWSNIVRSNNGMITSIAMDVFQKKFLDTFFPSPERRIDFRPYNDSYRILSDGRIVFNGKKQNVAITEILRQYTQGIPVDLRYSEGDKVSEDNINLKIDIVVRDDPSLTKITDRLQSHKSSQAGMETLVIEVPRFMLDTSDFKNTLTNYLSILKGSPQYSSAVNPEKHSPVEYAIIDKILKEYRLERNFISKELRGFLSDNKVKIDVFKQIIEYALYAKLDLANISNSNDFDVLRANALQHNINTNTFVENNIRRAGEATSRIILFILDNEALKTSFYDAQNDQEKEKVIRKAIIKYNESSITETEKIVNSDIDFIIQQSLKQKSLSQAILLARQTYDHFHQGIDLTGVKLGDKIFKLDEYGKIPGLSALLGNGNLNRIHQISNIDSRNTVFTEMMNMISSEVAKGSSIDEIKNILLKIQCADRESGKFFDAINEKALKQVVDYVKAGMIGNNLYHFDEEKYLALAKNSSSFDEQIKTFIQEAIQNNAHFRSSLQAMGFEFNNGQLLDSNYNELLTLVKTSLNRTKQDLELRETIRTHYETLYKDYQTSTGRDREKLEQRFKQDLPPQLIKALGMMTSFHALTLQEDAGKGNFLPRYNQLEAVYLSQYNRNIVLNVNTANGKGLIDAMHAVMRVARYQKAEINLPTVQDSIQERNRSYRMLRLSGVNVRVFDVAPNSNPDMLRELFVRADVLYTSGSNILFQDLHDVFSKTNNPVMLSAQERMMRVVKFSNEADKLLADSATPAIISSATGARHSKGSPESIAANRAEYLARILDLLKNEPEIKRLFGEDLNQLYLVENGMVKLSPHAFGKILSLTIGNMDNLGLSDKDRIALLNRRDDILKTAITNNGTDKEARLLDLDMEKFLIDEQVKAESQATGNRENTSTQSLLSQRFADAMSIRYMNKYGLDYIVNGKSIVLIDQSTGRASIGSQQQTNLLQAVEARHGIPISNFSGSSASVNLMLNELKYAFLVGNSGTINEVYYRYMSKGVEVVSVRDFSPSTAYEAPRILHKDSKSQKTTVLRNIFEELARQTTVFLHSEKATDVKDGNFNIEQSMAETTVIMEKLAKVFQDKLKDGDIRLESLDNLQIKKFFSDINLSNIIISEQELAKILKDAGLNKGSSHLVDIGRVNELIQWIHKNNETKEGLFRTITYNARQSNLEKINHGMYRIVYEDDKSEQGIKQEISSGKFIGVVFSSVIKRNTDIPYKIDNDNIILRQQLGAYRTDRGFSSIHTDMPKNIADFMQIITRDDRPTDKRVGARRFFHFSADSRIFLESPELKNYIESIKPLFEKNDFAVIGRSNGNDLHQVSLDGQYQSKSMLNKMGNTQEYFERLGINLSFDEKTYTREEAIRILRDINSEFKEDMLSKLFVEENGKYKICDITTIKNSGVNLTPDEQNKLQRYYDDRFIDSNSNAIIFEKDFDEQTLRKLMTEKQFEINRDSFFQKKEGTDDKFVFRRDLTIDSFQSLDETIREKLVTEWKNSSINLETMTNLFLEYQYLENDRQFINGQASERNWIRKSHSLHHLQMAMKNISALNDSDIRGTVETDTENLETRLRSDYERMHERGELTKTEQIMGHLHNARDVYRFFLPKMVDHVYDLVMTENRVNPGLEPKKFLEEFSEKFKRIYDIALPKYALKDGTSIAELKKEITIRLQTDLRITDPPTNIKTFLGTVDSRLAVIYAEYNRELQEIKQASEHYNDNSYQRDLIQLDQRLEKALALILSEKEWQRTGSLIDGGFAPLAERGLRNIGNGIMGNSSAVLRVNFAANNTEGNKTLLGTEWSTATQAEKTEAILRDQLSRFNREGERLHGDFSITIKVFNKVFNNDNFEFHDETYKIFEYGQANEDAIRELNNLLAAIGSKKIIMLNHNNNSSSFLYGNGDIKNDRNNNGDLRQTFNFYQLDTGAEHNNSLGYIYVGKKNFSGESTDPKDTVVIVEPLIKDSLYSRSIRPSDPNMNPFIQDIVKHYGGDLALLQERVDIENLRIGEIKPDHLIEYLTKDIGTSVPNKDRKIIEEWLKALIKEESILTKNGILEQKYNGILSFSEIDIIYRKAITKYFDQVKIEKMIFEDVYRAQVEHHEKGGHGSNLKILERLATVADTHTYQRAHLMIEQQGDFGKNSSIDIYLRSIKFLIEQGAEDSKDSNRNFSFNWSFPAERSQNLSSQGQHSADKTDETIKQLVIRIDEEVKKLQEEGKSETEAREITLKNLLAKMEIRLLGAFQAGMLSEHREQYARILQNSLEHREGKPIVIDGSRLSSTFSVFSSNIDGVVSEFVRTVDQKYSQEKQAEKAGSASNTEKALYHEIEIDARLSELENKARGAINLIYTAGGESIVGERDIQTQLDNIRMLLDNSKVSKTEKERSVNELIELIEKIKQELKEITEKEPAKIEYLRETLTELNVMLKYSRELLRMIKSDASKTDVLYFIRSLEDSCRVYNYNKDILEHSAGIRSIQSKEFGQIKIVTINKDGDTFYRVFFDDANVSSENILKAYNFLLANNYLKSTDFFFYSFANKTVELNRENLEKLAELFEINRIVARKTSSEHSINDFIQRYYALSDEDKSKVDTDEGGKKKVTIRTESGKDISIVLSEKQLDRINESKEVIDDMLKELHVFEKNALHKDYIQAILRSMSARVKITPISNPNETPTPKEITIPDFDIKINGNSAENDTLAVRINFKHDLKKDSRSIIENSAKISINEKPCYIPFQVVHDFMRIYNNGTMDQIKNELTKIKEKFLPQTSNKIPNEILIEQLREANREMMANQPRIIAVQDFAIRAMLEQTTISELIKTQRLVFDIKVPSESSSREEKMLYLERLLEDSKYLRSLDSLNNAEDRLATLEERINSLMNSLDSHTYSKLQEIEALRQSLFIDVQKNKWEVPCIDTKVSNGVRLLDEQKAKLGDTDIINKHDLTRLDPAMLEVLRTILADIQNSLNDNNDNNKKESQAIEQKKQTASALIDRMINELLKQDEAGLTRAIEINSLRIDYDIRLFKQKLDTYVYMLPNDENQRAQFNKILTRAGLNAGNLLLTENNIQFIKPNIDDIIRKAEAKLGENSADQRKALTELRDFVASLGNAYNNDPNYRSAIHGHIESTLKKRIHSYDYWTREAHLSSQQSERWLGRAAGMGNSVVAGFLSGYIAGMFSSIALETGNWLFSDDLSDEKLTEIASRIFEQAKENGLHFITFKSTLEAIKLFVHITPDKLGTIPYAPNGLNDFIKGKSFSRLAAQNFLSDITGPMAIYMSGLISFQVQQAMSEGNHEMVPRILATNAAITAIFSTGTLGAQYLLNKLYAKMGPEKAMIQRAQRLPLPLAVGMVMSGLLMGHFEESELMEAIDGAGKHLVDQGYGENLSRTFSYANDLYTASAISQLAGNKGFMPSAMSSNLVIPSNVAAEKKLISTLMSQKFAVGATLGRAGLVGAIMSTAGQWNNLAQDHSFWSLVGRGDVSYNSSIRNHALQDVAWHTGGVVAMSGAMTLTKITAAGLGFATTGAGVPVVIVGGIAVGVGLVSAWAYDQYIREKLVNDVNRSTEIVEEELEDVGINLQVNNREKDDDSDSLRRSIQRNYNAKLFGMITHKDFYFNEVFLPEIANDYPELHELIDTFFEDSDNVNLKQLLEKMKLKNIEIESIEYLSLDMFLQILNSVSKELLSNIDYLDDSSQSLSIKVSDIDIEKLECQDKGLSIPVSFQINFSNGDVANATNINAIITGYNSADYDEINFEEGVLVTRKPILNARENEQPYVLHKEENVSREMLQAKLFDASEKKIRPNLVRLLRAINKIYPAECQANELVSQILDGNFYNSKKLINEENISILMDFIIAQSKQFADDYNNSLPANSEVQIIFENKEGKYNLKVISVLLDSSNRAEEGESLQSIAEKNTVGIDEDNRLLEEVLNPRLNLTVFEIFGEGGRIHSFKYKETKEALIRLYLLRQLVYFNENRNYNFYEVLYTINQIRDIVKDNKELLNIFNKELQQNLYTPMLDFLQGRFVDTATDDTDTKIANSNFARAIIASELLGKTFDYDEEFEDTKEKLKGNFTSLRMRGNLLTDFELSDTNSEDKWNNITALYEHYMNIERTKQSENSPAEVALSTEEDTRDVDEINERFREALGLSSIYLDQEVISQVPQVISQVPIVPHYIYSNISYHDNIIKAHRFNNLDSFLEIYELAINSNDDELKMEFLKKFLDISGGHGWFRMRESWFLEDAIPKVFELIDSMDEKNSIDLYIQALNLANEKLSKHQSIRDIVMTKTTDLQNKILSELENSLDAQNPDTLIRYLISFINSQNDFVKVRGVDLLLKFLDKKKPEERSRILKQVFKAVYKKFDINMRMLSPSQTQIVTTFLYDILNHVNFVDNPKANKHIIRLFNKTMKEILDSDNLGNRRIVIELLKRINENLIDTKAISLDDFIDIIRQYAESVHDSNYNDIREIQEAETEFFDSFMEKYLEKMDYRKITLVASDRYLMNGYPEYRQNYWTTFFYNYIKDNSIENENTERFIKRFNLMNPNQNIF